jgi:hypothetical protein
MPKDGGEQKRRRPPLAALLAAAPRPGEPDRLIDTFGNDGDREACRVLVEAALVQLGMQKRWCIHAAGYEAAPEPGHRRPEWVLALFLHAYTETELAQLDADRALLQRGDKDGLRQDAAGDAPAVLGVVR